MKASNKESVDSHPSKPRYRGTVQWFNASMGYGFIKPENHEVNQGKDLFVHFHNVVLRGFKTLNPGDVVEFCLGSNKNGVAAQEVKILKGADWGEA